MKKKKSDTAYKKISSSILLHEAEPYTEEQLQGLSENDEASRRHVEFGEPMPIRRRAEREPQSEPMPSPTPTGDNASKKVPIESMEDKWKRFKLTGEW